MFAIKVKTKDKNNVIFEVLTRGILNNYDFTIEKDIFHLYFKQLKKNTKKLDVNIVKTMKDIFYCEDNTFPEKIYWWNNNIQEIDFLYNELYKKNICKEFALKQDMFNNYVEEYNLKFKENYAYFIKDHILFTDLFNSARKTQ
jgi:hypothetical protein